MVEGLGVSCQTSWRIGDGRRLRQLRPVAREHRNPCWVGDASGAFTTWAAAGVAGERVCKPVVQEGTIPVPNLWGRGLGWGEVLRQM